MRMPKVADKIKFYLGDVRYLQSVKSAMHGINYIFHAIALKQVPFLRILPNGSGLHKCDRNRLCFNFNGIVI